MSCDRERLGQRSREVMGWQLQGAMNQVASFAREL